MDQRTTSPGYAFISYVRDDARAVDRLDEALVSAGIDVWRDTDNLWPGQDWRERIRNAITSKSLVFIACFSTVGLTRAKSYQNEEITLAIDEMRKRPAAEPWIIPVRLDDCRIPDRYIGGGLTFGSLQRADLFGASASGNLDRLVSTVLRMLGCQSSATDGGHVHAASSDGRVPLARPRPDAIEPTFGIVTALPEEFAAMSSFIGNQRRAHVAGDPADYTLGTLPSSDPTRAHRVVLTLLGETGNDAAASATANLLRSYPSVRCLLMVGIAAGVPDPARPERHVRLGDIVVARRGIAEYDSVRDNDDGPTLLRSFPPPSPLLERRARRLKAGEAIGSRPWEDLLAAQAHVLPEFSRPAESTDVLHSADGSQDEIAHPDAALSGHRPGQPKVHSGLIASGDRSLRSAVKRDDIAAAHDVLAIEMEGKGIGNAGFYQGVDWFTVRGISDYGDRHVSRIWRNYAALAAAAYTRALLAETPPLGESQPSPAGAAPVGRSAGARQLDVLDARISQSLLEPIIVLMDRQAGKFFAILASQAEAVSITYAKDGVRSDQDPGQSASYVLPHDLAVSVADAADLRIDGCELRGGANLTLVASIKFSNGRRVAATPADAIAVALRAGAPITVPASLLDQAAALPGEHDDMPWKGAIARDAMAREVPAPTAFGPVPGTMPVVVAGVTAEPGAAVAMLTSEKTGRSRQVLVSPIEAAAIEWALRGSASPGPSTHLLLRDVLVTAGARLLATIIGERADGAFGGELLLSGDRKVRARAGDSIALALLSGAATLTTTGGGASEPS